MRVHKAIQLQIRLWIEGEDEPTHNFAVATTQAVKEILSVGRARHSKLKITIKNIVKDNEYYEDEKPDD
jgi:hypothetical protein